MNCFKLAQHLFLLLFFSYSYAQFTDEINSNRPGESMSAFSVGKTVIQAEFGCNGINENHAKLDYNAIGLNSDLTLRYGAFLEQLELIMNVQYQVDWYESDFEKKVRNDLKQTLIGVKYLVYDPNKNYEKKPNLYSWKANHKFSYRAFIPALAIYAGANLNFSDNTFSLKNDPFISPKAMLITQNQFGKFVFVTNIFADKITSEFPTFGYVATLTRGFSQRWTGFIENKGVQSDFYTDGIIRCGAAFLMKETIQIDASIGTNVKNTPNYIFGGFGISWRFDENYNDVINRVKKEKGKKDKGKDKKDKGKDNSNEKANKRKDSFGLEIKK
jgi:hypothetical protein